MTVPKKPHKAIKQPRILDDLATDGVSEGLLRDHERYEYMRLEQANFTGQIAKYVNFESSRLAHVSMRDADLTGLKLVDVRLDDCDLANTDWYQSGLKRVEIVGCRMVGLKAAEGKLQDVLFKECRGRLALFRFATLKSVRFEDCDLVEADFQSADLSGVRFAGCDLSNAEMRGAKLQGADFRGSNVDGLKVGFTELQGAIVDPLQAVSFVRLLGLTVKAENQE